MTEETLTTLLERAGNLTEVGPAPLDDIARGAQRRQRRQNVKVTFVAVAAIAALVFGTALAKEVVHAVGPGQVTTHITRTDVVPDLRTKENLQGQVDDWARLVKRPVVRAQAVRSYRSDAMMVLSGISEPEHTPVWVVEIEFARPFTLSDQGLPSSTPSPPKPRVVGLVVSANKEFLVIDGSEGRSWHDLGQLGRIIPLHKPSNSASY
jgi:hypothetical protein